MDKFILNLQRFATPNTNVTTDSGLTPEMKTFYKTQLLQFAEPELLFQKFGKKVDIPQNNGKTIEFRYMDPLPVVTSDLTEGVTPNGNKFAFNALTETLHQYGYWIAYSDVVKWTTVDPVIAEVTLIEKLSFPPIAVCGASVASASSAANAVVNAFDAKA